MKRVFYLIGLLLGYATAEQLEKGYSFKEALLKGINLTLHVIIFILILPFVLIRDLIVKK